MEIEQHRERPVALRLIHSRHQHTLRRAAKLGLGNFNVEFLCRIVCSRHGVALHLLFWRLRITDNPLRQPFSRIHSAPSASPRSSSDPKVISPQGMAFSPTIQIYSVRDSA